MHIFKILLLSAITVLSLGVTTLANGTSKAERKPQNETPPMKDTFGCFSTTISAFKGLEQLEQLIVERCNTNLPFSNGEAPKGTNAGSVQICCTGK